MKVKGLQQSKLYPTGPAPISGTAADSTGISHLNLYYTVSWHFCFHSQELLSQSVSGDDIIVAAFHGQPGHQGLFS